MPETQILANLQDRCHPINYICAIAGIDDLSAADLALNELITDGKVEKRIVQRGYDKFNTPILLTAYVVTIDYSELNNTNDGPHLAVVK